MNQDLRAKFQTNTFYYILIMLCVLTVTHLTSTLIIIFGDLEDKEIVITGTLVMITLIGSFGLIRLTRNFKLLQNEMDDELSQTNFGRETKAIPVDRLGIVFSVLFLGNAIIQLVSIYS